MSKHIAEWLSSYLDGELRGIRLQQVEVHLAECQSCREELASLRRLSNWLGKAPVPEFIPTERFAARVSLRLPQRQTADPVRVKILELGWWIIPVGLLGAWILVNILFLAGDVVSAATQFGLLTDVSDSMIFGSASPAYWTRALALWGVLHGDSLNWAASIEAFTRAALPQITLQLWIALLYLSWIAIWWTHRTSRPFGRPLER